MKKKGSFKTLIFTCLLLFAFVSYAAYLYRQEGNNKELLLKDKKAEEKILMLKQEINNKKELIAKSKTYEFIELIARDELGMIKPNEILVIDKSKKDIFNQNK